MTPENHPFAPFIREVSSHQHDILNEPDVSERIAAMQDVLEGIKSHPEVRKNPMLAAKVRSAEDILRQIARQKDHRIREELMKGLMNRMN